MIKLNGASHLPSVHMSTNVGKEDPMDSVEFNTPVLIKLGSFAGKVGLSVIDAFRSECWRIFAR